jgi:hypothetical protein
LCLLAEILAYFNLLLQLVFKHRLGIRFKHRLNDVVEFQGEQFTWLKQPKKPPVARD